VTTAAGLRVDAASASAEADRLRDVARRAQALSLDIDPLLDAAAALFGPQTWRGASERRCAQQLADHQGRLASARADVEDACDRIRSQARALDERAEALMAESGRLQDQEAAQRRASAGGRAVAI